MRLGIAVQGSWGFFEEIYADLSAHHQTQLFSPRKVAVPFVQEWVNWRLFRRDLQTFLNRNDVVFFEWASGLLKAASQLRKAAGYVTRLHRYELYQWANKIKWETVDKIILVSKAKQREFSERLPEHASKTVVIPEAISLEKYEFQPRPFRGDIGILCHITPRKRVYELILAFYELLRSGYDFRLHIGGGQKPLYMDYYNAVHALVKKLCIQNQVIFYDHVDNPQTWYHNIDILISNSYSEGLQVSPMEAMASGCYCLSHFWDGVEEMLPAENLYLTNGELIEKILQYSDASENERQSRRELMRSIVDERFNIDKIKFQIRSVIEQVEAI